VSSSSVRKAWPLPAVAGRKLGGEPAFEGRRRAAKVDRHVERAAPDAAHQLRLGLGRGLEMDAAQRASAPGQGVVGLHEVVQYAVFVEDARTVGFLKEAALIGEDGWRDDDNARQTGRLERPLHQSLVSDTSG